MVSTRQLTLGMDYRQIQPTKSSISPVPSRPKFSGQVSPFYRTQNGDLFFTVQPKVAMDWNIDQTLENLKAKIGEKQLREALNPRKTITSPIQGEPDDTWLHRMKITGFNPRMAIGDQAINPQFPDSGSFWNVVNYAMTTTDNAIHMFPIWEPGTGGSIYAPISWNLNWEFFDPRLAEASKKNNLFPEALDTPEKQLHVAVNLIHAMGKTIGLDVVQHTDSFSEMVLTNPRAFWWFDFDTTRPHNDEQVTPTPADIERITQGVESIVVQYIKDYNATHTGSEQIKCGNPDQFFKALTPDQRVTALFPTEPHPKASVQEVIQWRKAMSQRRVELMNLIKKAKFQPAPAAMAIPYHTYHIYRSSDDGMWPIYDDSQAYGSLTQWAVWKRKPDGNITGETQDDVNGPVRQEVYDHIGSCMKDFGFDFIRADMGHIQMRQKGADPSLSFWNGMKRAASKITGKKIAILAESFPGTQSMGVSGDPRYGYGDGELNAQKDGFTTYLGRMLYLMRGGEALINYIRGINMNNRTPSSRQAIVTTSADDDVPNYPPAQEFNGNPREKLVNEFFRLFINNQPGYTHIGYETRGLSNPESLSNFAQPFNCQNPALGRYQWGNNQYFFTVLTQMRKVYQDYAQIWQKQSHYWLNLQDVNDGRQRGAAAWMTFDASHKNDTLYVLNAHACNPKDDVTQGEACTIHNVTFSNPLNDPVLQAHPGESEIELEPIYTTLEEYSANQPPKRLQKIILHQGQPLTLTNLGPGEGRIFRVIHHKPN